METIKKMWESLKKYPIPKRVYYISMTILVLFSCIGGLAFLFFGINLLNDKTWMIVLCLWIFIILFWAGLLLFQRPFVIKVIISNKKESWWKKVLVVLVILIVFGLMSYVVYISATDLLGGTKTYSGSCDLSISFSRHVGTKYYVVIPEGGKEKKIQITRKDYYALKGKDSGEFNCSKPIELLYLPTVGWRTKIEY